MTSRRLVNIILVCSFVFSFFAACNTDNNHGNDPVSQKAGILADSIDDVKELKSLIRQYKAKKQKRAELVVRLKYGKVLRDLSMFNSAILQHDTCIMLSHEINDSILLIKSLFNQGTNLRRVGNIPEAIDMHYESLTICDKISDTDNDELITYRTRTMNGLGNIFLSLKNYEEANKLFRRALISERQTKNATGIAINLANIGSVKESSGDSDSAMIYYKQSLEYNISCGNAIGIGLCNMYIGKLEEKKGNIRNAIAHYRKSYEISQPTGDAWHWIEPCVALINAYIKENKLDSAYHFIEISLSKAYEIHSVDHLARIHALCANYHEKKGDYAQAIKDVHYSQQYYDSVSLEKSQSHMQNVRVNYEESKTQAAVANAEYEKHIRNTVIHTSLTFIAICALAIFALWRMAKERKKASKALEMMNEERQDFYRGVTHQLRTPLTVVIGMTQQLHKYIPKGDSLAEREFEAVERQCNHLLKLVTDMIEYSKNGKLKAPSMSELTIAESSKSITELQEEIKSRSIDNRDGTKNYVLLAEDDPDVALLITEMLKNEGYNYAWAKDGLEAWDMLNENLPDILITDIMMPRMDGLQLMKNIRNDEDMNHLPIIVVSARVANEDRLVGIEAGAEVYLGKPFLPNELLLRIRKLLEQRMLLRNKFQNNLQIIQKEAVPSVQIIQQPAPVIKNEKEDSKVVVSDTEEKDAYSDSNLTNRERAFIDSVDSCIKDNLSNPELSSAMLAEKLNTTTCTLNRRLKNITDIDTTHYIRMHRMAKVKDLLVNTDMSMVDIQTACGFDTPSYFSRTFKADVGMTPSEYRKQA